MDENNINESKKYYWLKLKNDFFDDKKIKKLRTIAGGDTYTIIYLKLQLLSLKNNGELIFENVEDNFIEELALEINEDSENVKVTIMFLIKTGLIEEVEDNKFLLPETQKSIGFESHWAEKKRKYRAEKDRKEIGQCPTNVLSMSDKSIDKELDIDIDIDKELDIDNISSKLKHKYGLYKHILLSDKELSALKNEYPNYEELIKYLDEAIEMKGYKYKNHYLAIKKWVVNAVRENNIKSKLSNNNRSNGFMETLKEVYSDEQ